MKKKVLILDLDGTLYYQPLVQLFMGGRMILYYLFHFWRGKELKAILAYRKYREQEESKDWDDQFRVIAEKYKMTIPEVKRLTDTWLLQKPLSVIHLWKDRTLAKIIEEFSKQKGQVIIYSDYPTKEKMKALKIPYQKSYDATMPQIHALKPNPKGLSFIIQENHFKKEEILMVGDRDEKDGKCARALNIDVIIVPKCFRRKEHLEIKKQLGVKK